MGGMATSLQNKISDPKKFPTRRWWFVGERWSDEVLIHQKNPRWQWWSEAVPLMNADYLKFCWRGGEERAAYCYELARRSSISALKLPTYPELTADEQDFIKELFGRSDARWAAFSRCKGRSAQIPAVFWNLTETNASLVKLFLNLIGQARDAQGLPTPRTRPQNNRPFHWRSFDLLDSDVATGDDSRRSQRSKLRKMCKTFARRLTCEVRASRSHSLHRLAASISEAAR